MKRNFEPDVRSVSVLNLCESSAVGVKVNMAKKQVRKYRLLEGLQVVHDDNDLSSSSLTRRFTASGSSSLC